MKESIEIGKLTMYDYARMVNEYLKPLVDVIRAIEDNGGEVTPELEDAYNTAMLKSMEIGDYVKESALQKVVATAYYTKSLKGQLDFSKEQKKKADDFRKQQTKYQENLRDMMINIMEGLDTDYIKVNGKTVVSLVKTTDVKIVDHEKLLNNCFYYLYDAPVRSDFAALVDDALAITYLVNRYKDLLDIKYVWANKKELKEAIIADNLHEIAAKWGIEIVETVSLRNYI